MAHKLVFMLKTFEDDLHYVERLIPSYRKYNTDLIPMCIVAPEKDVELFSKFKCKDIQIIAEESVTDCLVSDNSVFGIRPGYINQEIIKLAFWEMGLCDNYLCIDSDAEFLRDFYFSDFMSDANTPFTILAEDNELVVDPEYYKEHWIGREKLIQVIKKELGVEDRRTLTCHGMSIFSAKVLKTFKEKYLIPRGYTYVDALKKSPYEFSWYNFWLQKDKTIPILFREPLFKTFHNKSQHLEYIRKNITLNDISRGYLGIVMNSNYSRDFGVISYDTVEPYKNSLDIRILRRLRIYGKLLFDDIRARLK
jgi:hypothetical protein